MSEKQDLLTVREAAAFLRMGKSSVMRLISNKRVDVVRLNPQGTPGSGKGKGGRIFITRASLEGLIAASTTLADSKSEFDLNLSGGVVQSGSTRATA